VFRISSLILLGVSILSASDYGLKQTVVEGVQVFTLTDSKQGVEAGVAPAYGNNAYSLKWKGRELMWSPYSTIGEAANKPAMLGNPFLWPWANRIDGTSYWINDRKYDFNLNFGNVSAGPNQTPIHGLLRYDKRWVVEDAGADNESAWLTARLDFYQYPDLMTQFPFAHVVKTTFRLKQGALEVQTEVENLTHEKLPISLGYHPYFTLPGVPRDQWVVHLPAKTHYKLSDRVLPTGETEANPFANEFGVKGKSVDDVFGDLQRDQDGFARFSVTGGDLGLMVEYGPEYPIAVVYSPEDKDFICFEPMSGVTNAFNAAHDGWFKGLQSAPAKGSWKGVFRIRPVAGR
jgi:aldose 1-epimerase